MSSAQSPSSSDRGFLLHVFQRHREGRSVIFAVGRLESGGTFALVDDRHAPSFFIRSSDLAAAQSHLGDGDLSVRETDWTTMDGETVWRVEARQQKTARQLAERLHKIDVRTYEADVAFDRQYLMDRGIRGAVRISGSWRQGSGVDRVYQNPQLEPDDWEPQLSALALDIETDMEASQIFAVSLVGFGTERARQVEEIHIVGLPTPDDPPHLYCHGNEGKLIEALSDRVRSIDPDILTGWNLIDFDLPVIQRRAKAHGQTFNLGRSSDASWYREGDVWGGSRVVVYGRQVLDAMHLFRSVPRAFDDYRLETVARAVLGRGKAAEPGPHETLPQFILRAYREDRSAFCEYCLEDSRLVRDALEKEGLIQLSLRRSLLTGLPLERAWGSVAAFDFLYISELHKRGLVAPTNGVDRRGVDGAPGGLVLEAEVGLYRNIFVFDFKSLYPSIIRTFNIDPLALVRATSCAQPITAPNGASFDRDVGILPALLDVLFTSREHARATGDELASLAYKIVMNSFYGVLGTDACRFAEGSLAGAITGFGHDILRWAKDLLERDGAGRVLYGDTDSLFVDADLPKDIGAEDALAKGRQLSRWMNDQLADHLQREYGVVSRLDLEFEKLYRRLFLPPMRGSGDRARAKGYAGLKVGAAGKEELEIVGMEAVRRDWTDLAHDLQRDLLSRLFREAPADEMESAVTAWIRAVRCGEKDGDLVYRKSLRRSLESYTSSSPPHVTAARLLPEPSGVIHYVLTAAGPQPVGFVTAPLDYEHYIEKQIRPIVATIGQVCDIDVEAAVTGMPDLFRSARLRPD